MRAKKDGSYREAAPCQTNPGSPIGKRANGMKTIRHPGVLSSRIEAAADFLTTAVNAMSKPHISFRSDFFFGHHWACRLSDDGTRCGRGSTPMEAFIAWKNWKPWANIGVGA